MVIVVDVDGGGKKQPARCVTRPLTRAHLPANYGDKGVIWPKTG